MRKRDKILFILAVLGDILEEVRDPMGFSALPYKEVYGFVPHTYKKHNFRAAFLKSYRVGNCEKIIKNDEDYFKLTDKGKEKFNNEFPLNSFYKKNWDKKWRILVFDVEEAKKEKRFILRRKLCSLGFGKLQKSVYISPFKVEKEMRSFLKDNDLENYVKVFVGDIENLEEAKITAESVWKITKLNEQYFEVYKKFTVNKNNLLKLQDIKSEYIELLMGDPYLPMELLPKPFYRDKISEELKRIRIIQM